MAKASRVAWYLLPADLGGIHADEVLAEQLKRLCGIGQCVVDDSVKAAEQCVVEK